MKLVKLNHTIMKYSRVGTVLILALASVPLGTAFGQNRSENKAADPAFSTGVTPTFSYKPDITNQTLIRK